MKRTAALVPLLALIALTLMSAGAQAIRVTGQILAYQDGYVFFTTGDGFRVAPAIVLKDAKTGGATALRPGPRLWALATFDASGSVVELDLSLTALAPQGNFALVKRYAIALSSPFPNPDLAQAPAIPGRPNMVFTGRQVVVVFEVRVPPTTPLEAIVYITTDASGWNPQAIPMQRIDALHFKVIERLVSGTIFHYLYTRGSFASEERSEGGLEEHPRTALVSDADSQVYSNIVYRWADEAMPGQVIQPNVFPTPYNPAPFPNLPPGIHTPHP
ncbi:MAG TPA: hypothetical protein VIN40_09735 [Candidatus Tyrphobacter sp.]